MEKLRIICSNGFLKYFFEEIDRSYDSILNEIYEYLFRNEIQLVLPNDTVTNELSENSYWNRIVRAEKSGWSKLDYYPNVFSSIDEDEDYLKGFNPCTAIFLLDKGIIECKSLEEKYGMLFFSKDDFVQRANILVNIDIVEISEKKNSPINWGFLRQYKHPCNSLIIYDKYLFSEDSSSYNTIRIIEEILPQKLINNEFHLYVIASSKNRISSKKWHDRISNEIKRNYKLKLTVLILDEGSIDAKRLHDRFMITNYFLFYSGHSFTYFKPNNDVIKTTFFQSIPITHRVGNSQNVFSLVQNMLENLKEIIINPNNNNYHGTKKCRLYP